MSTENLDVVDPQEVGNTYSNTINALQQNDRMVYIEGNKTFKGKVLALKEKNGIKEVTFQPDKVNNHPKPITIILTPATAKKVDGLFSVNEEGVKYNREFAYLEVKEAISKGYVYGLTYEQIGQSNINSLMAGNRTNVIKDVPFSYTDENGSRKIVSDARLELTRNKDGQLRVGNLKVKEEINLSEPFYGRNFTTDEKKKLLETGTLGLVEGFVNTKSGEVYNLWVGFDNQLKRPVARPAFAIKADQIYGKSLSKEDQAKWIKGEPVTLDSVGKDKTTRIYIANGASRNKNGIASYTLEKAQELGIVKGQDEGKDKKASKENDVSQSSGKGKRI